MTAKTNTRICETYPNGHVRAGMLYGTTLRKALAMFGPAWTDAHIPRTDTPVQFVRGRVEPFGVRWGLRNRYAVTPSRIAR